MFMYEWLLPIPSSLPQRSIVLSSIVPPPTSVTASSLPRMYATCCACHVLIAISLSREIVSLSDLCERSWCSSGQPAKGKCCQLSELAHMSVDTFVKPQVCARSMRSTCSLLMSGNEFIASGSDFVGNVIGMHATAPFESCCSTPDNAPRCESRRALSSEFTRVRRRPMSSFKKSSTLFRSATIRARSDAERFAFAKIRLYIDQGSFCAVFG